MVTCGPRAGVTMRVEARPSVAAQRRAARPGNPSSGGSGVGDKHNARGNLMSVRSVKAALGTFVMRGSR